MINLHFWKNKKIFITGHTGFKGSWLSLWLNLLGAEVTGYALRPPTEPNLFTLSGLEKDINSITGDIRQSDLLSSVMVSANPDIVIHMAAQPLVRDSYVRPVETYETNVLGTVNVLEAVRKCNKVKAAVVVTTDKCYDNKEWFWGYREDEALGGYDPYSSSKACAELVTAAYRNSFFNLDDYSEHGVAVASVRAGNVIGGGDWAKDRLIPDFFKAVVDNRPITIRNPQAIRPWQHVLEPLGGYMVLTQKLYEVGPDFAEAWNFGPDDSDAKTVEWIMSHLCNSWGNNTRYIVDADRHPHEAHYLKLDCSKAKAKLAWHPRWALELTLDKIIEWYKAYFKGDDMRRICEQQISTYMKAGE